MSYQQTSASKKHQLIKPFIRASQNNELTEAKNEFRNVILPEVTNIGEALEMVFTHVTGAKPLTNFGANTYLDAIEAQSPTARKAIEEVALERHATC